MASDKLTTPGILPSDLFAEAGRKVLRFQFTSMLHHENGTRIDFDFEELHDMRVATRRMRAALDVFSDAYRSKILKRILKGLGNTGKALGGVRDYDVLIQNAKNYLTSVVNIKQNDLGILIDAWSVDREFSRIKMLKYMDSEKYSALKEDINRFVNTPGKGVNKYHKKHNVLVKDIALDLILCCVEDIKTLKESITEPNVNDLHKLRIKFKKLRYTIEFFREILCQEVNDVIDDLKKIQDHLGDLHDSDVASKEIQKFIEAWNVQYPKPSLLEQEQIKPIYLYLEVTNNKLLHLVDTFPDVWKFYQRSAFQKNLRSALSILDLQP